MAPLDPELRPGRPQGGAAPAASGARRAAVGSRWVEIAAGCAAALVGALLVGWLQAAQGLLASGSRAVTPNDISAGLYLLMSLVAGAAFGAVFRYRPGGYGATIGSGLLAGLLWWIVWSLTIQQLLAGRAPTWSLAEAAVAFPFLVGDLVFGGVLGVGLSLLPPLLLGAHVRLTDEQPPPGPPVRVLILGGGFGGITAARELEHALPRSAPVEVTLVSESNYLLFTPLLAEVASSALEPQHISVPLRAFAPGTVFRQARVEAIDVAARTVRLQAGRGIPAEQLPYDHLVLALGAVPNYRGLPGLAEHAFNLKTLEDATRLRNHVIGLLERANVEPDPAERRRQLTFVVAGGGFAGAELVAQLFDLVHGVRRYYPGINREELRFLLVHSQERILPELSSELAGYALGKLRDKGIVFHLSTRVEAVTPGTVTVVDGRVLPPRTFVIPTRTTVWTAGNQPNPLLRTVDLPSTRGGAVDCHGTLRVKGSDNVWAVGDCASVPNPTEGGAAYPPTAQHALRQGKTVARNIAAVVQGRPPKRFRFSSLGMLVDLGHQQAAAEIRGFQFSGLVAWLMWRGIYLSKLPGLEKKIRVLLDWVLDLFFPRDLVLTQNPHGVPEQRGDRVPERVG